MSGQSELERLARFACSVRHGETPIPEAVLDHGKRIVADTFAAIVAGRTVPEMARLRAGINAQTSPLLEAFLDGSAGVALELDEGCASSRGHPAIHVLPAALNTARTTGPTGSAFLRSFIAAYELAARIGHATTFRPLIHPHGTWGTCGAAGVAALLRGFDHAQLASALKIAGSLPVATHYNSVYAGATARNLWSGLGNLNGLLAVEAAAASFTGSDDSLAGTMGDSLGTAFDRDLAATGLGERWFVLENYFKQYPCCRHAHVAIDAFRAVLDEHDVDRARIRTIRVETYQRAADAVGRIRMPATPLQAKFSLPFILAAVAEGAAMTRADFEAEGIARYGNSPISERVEVQASEELTALLPKRAARVTVTLEDGQVFANAQTGSHGDAEDPLTAEELEAKFHALAAPAIGAAAAERTLAEIGRLEQLDAAALKALADAAGAATGS